MKLRYLASARMPTEKAHGIQIMNMCSAFAHAGAQVELVVPNRKNGTTGDSFEYYSIPKNFTIRFLKVTDLTGFARIFGRFAYLLLANSFARRAQIDARKNPADIYFHRDEQTFIRFAQAGLPSIFEMHTVPQHLERYREAFANCIAIVAISRGIRDELLSANVPAEKIILAPDGVDLKRFSKSIVERGEARKQLNLDPHARIALYAGQLFPWKGADTLVASGAYLKEGSHILIVGGGAGREQELKAVAQRLKSRVVFAGQVRHELVPLYLSSADIVVIPNSGKDRIGSHHTSPLKLFEAMAMGKAIIASDLPALREILDDTSALFVQPDEPQALGKAIASLLADPIRQKKLGATAHDLVQRFDWHARAEYILKAIKRLDRTP
jgi:glycosyltransferase involved in cell wall biosynthesis